MIKHRYAFLIYLAAFLLQPFLQNLIPFFGENVNLILCLTVMLVFVHENPSQGIFFGCVFSLLWDLFYGLYTGPSAVAMLVCGVAVYLLKYFTHIENFLNGALFMVGGTLLFGSAYWCVYAAIGTTYSYVYAMGSLLPQLICNLIVGLGVYFVLIENVKKQRRDRYYR
jgi:rod shape-determining protein MreD